MLSQFLNMRLQLSHANHAEADATTMNYDRSENGKHEYQTPEAHNYLQ